MITLRVNGTDFEGFTRITANRAYTAVPGSFSFTATTSPDDLTTFPILEGDSCQVMIDDVAFITGYVDQIDVSHDDSSHEISVQGRSNIADLLDSTMTGSYEIKGPMPLKTALTKIISMSGVENVTVLDDTGGVDDFTKDESLSGQIGSQMWEFMTTLAIKKNVLLTENGAGNVVMTRGYGEKIDDVLTKEPNGANNNIKQSSCTRSLRQRFYEYTVQSQADSSSLAGLNLGNLDSTDTTETVGRSFDDVIRTSRSQCIIAEKSSDLNDCKARAKWQANFNRTMAFSYSCTIQGFVNSAGDPFIPGMMPHVKDDFMNVDSDLIIDSVSISYSENEGSNTTIKCLVPDAFTLTANEPHPDDTGNDYGGIFG